MRIWYEVYQSGTTQGPAKLLVNRDTERDAIAALPDDGFIVKCTRNVVHRTYMASRQTEKV
jgi:hypothetical protein